MNKRRRYKAKARRAAARQWSAAWRMTVLDRLNAFFVRNPPPRYFDTSYGLGPVSRRGEA